MFFDLNITKHYSANDKSILQSSCTWAISPLKSTSTKSVSVLFLTNAAKLDLMAEGLKRIKNLQITKKFVAWIDIILPSRN